MHQLQLEQLNLFIEFPGELCNLLPPLIRLHLPRKEQRINRVLTRYLFERIIQFTGTFV